jgi:isopenicillin N synthase-like dioxygenase
MRPLAFTTIATLAGAEVSGHHGHVSSVRTALPVVDLRDDPAALRERLRTVAHEVGFFYLTGHGVSEHLTDRLLRQARRLFALPDVDKAAIAMRNSPHFRGYTRLGGELTGGVVDWREQIDIGPQRAPIGGPGKPDYLWLQGPNQWPSGLPELPAVVAEWDAALAEVGRTLLRHWAISLGSPAAVFDDAFAGSPATLIKIVRYPAQADTPQGIKASEATGSGVGAHRDAGVLTLLLAEPGSSGLQVRDPASEATGNEAGASEATGNGAGASEATGNEAGEWIDVDPVPGAFIVNIGEMLEVASGGYLRATEHRVRLSARERISVPYFFNPRLDAAMPVLELPDELAVYARGVSMDTANERIYSVYGRNAWKSRLRAHPDVAAQHGYV